MSVRHLRGTVSPGDILMVIGLAVALMGVYLLIGLPPVLLVLGAALVAVGWQAG